MGIEKMLRMYLLQEDIAVVYGDSGYLGIQNRPEIVKNKHFSKIDFRINLHPRNLQKFGTHLFNWDKYTEYRKSAIHCKVEHAFRIIMCQLGYQKTAFRGLEKRKSAARCVCLRQFARSCYRQAKTLHNLI